MAEKTSCECKLNGLKGKVDGGSTVHRHKRLMENQWNTRFCSHFCLQDRLIDYWCFTLTHGGHTVNVHGSKVSDFANSGSRPINQHVSAQM